MKNRAFFFFAGGRRKLHNKELHNLYSFLNICMVKSRRRRIVGHVAHMGEEGRGEERSEYTVSET
jgi:hypothetical protein